MIDRPDPSPLTGCRVRVTPREATTYTPAHPGGEGIVESVHDASAVVRFDDGTAVDAARTCLTVLDMDAYRANLDRGREPDAWDACEARFSEEPYATPEVGFVPIGPWRPVSSRADHDGVWLLWERPLLRVSR